MNREKLVSLFNQLEESTPETLPLILNKLDLSVIPYSHEILEPDMKTLTGLLIKIFFTLKESSRKGSIVFLLGKLYRKDLKKFFIKVMYDSLKGDPEVLWQAMVALDNLNESILSPVQGAGSILNVSVNQKLAKKYLEEQEPETGPDMNGILK